MISTRMRPFILGMAALSPVLCGRRAGSARQATPVAGTPVPIESFLPDAINSRMQLVGALDQGDGLPRAALWEPGGKVTDLGHLTGGRDDSSRATDINDRGEIVGVSLGYADLHAVTWLDGEIRALGNLPDYQMSAAAAISNRGWIAGFSARSDMDSRAVLWKDGQIVDLGTFPGDTMSQATGINDAGQIVGVSGIWPDVRPVLWDGLRVVDLGLPPGDTEGWPVDINNAGQVVGWASAGQGQPPHAVLWDNGGAVNLGLLQDMPGSMATAINDAGTIVGVARAGDDRAPDLDAFVWENGVMRALQDPDRSASVAADIADSGDIAGTFDGRPVIFVDGGMIDLTEIPPNR